MHLLSDSEKILKELLTPTIVKEIEKRIKESPLSYKSYRLFVIKLSDNYPYSFYFVEKFGKNPNWIIVKKYTFQGDSLRVITYESLSNGNIRVIYTHKIINNEVFYLDNDDYETLANLYLNKINANRFVLI